MKHFEAIASVVAFVYFRQKVWVACRLTYWTRLRW